MLAKTPEEKYKAVYSAYVTDIIPRIHALYVITSQVRESFLLVHCAILSLSGFYQGTKDTNGTTYQKFVADFFPNYYSPTDLWKNLRNGLVHGYTFTGSYILAHKHPNNHMAIIERVKSEKTGQRANLTVLNFENFFQDFETAAISYFESVDTQPELLEKLCKRYEFAPPVLYIRNNEVPEGSILDYLSKI